MGLLPVLGGLRLGEAFVNSYFFWYRLCLHSSFAYRDFSLSAASSEIGDNESERAYDPVGDRVPGNPLFPSNFARLALGPTLRAKCVFKMASTLLLTSDF